MADTPVQAVRNYVNTAQADGFSEEEVARIRELVAAVPETQRGEIPRAIRTLDMTTLDQNLARQGMTRNCTVRNLLGVHITSRPELDRAPRLDGSRECLATGAPTAAPRVALNVAPPSGVAPSGNPQLDRDRAEIMALAQAGQQRQDAMLTMTKVTTRIAGTVQGGFWGGTIATGGSIVVAGGWALLAVAGVVTAPAWGTVALVSAGVIGLATVAGAVAGYNVPGYFGL